MKMSLNCVNSRFVALVYILTSYNAAAIEMQLTPEVERTFSFCLWVNFLLLWLMFDECIGSEAFVLPFVTNLFWGSISPEHKRFNSTIM